MTYVFKVRMTNCRGHPLQRIHRDTLVGTSFSSALKKATILRPKHGVREDIWFAPTHSITMKRFACCGEIYKKGIVAYTHPTSPLSH